MSRSSVIILTDFIKSLLINTHSILTSYKNTDDLNFQRMTKMCDLVIRWMTMIFFLISNAMYYQILVKSDITTFYAEGQQCSAENIIVWNDILYWFGNKDIKCKKSWSRVARSCLIWQNYTNNIICFNNYQIRYLHHQIIVVNIADAKSE